MAPMELGLILTNFENIYSCLKCTCFVVILNKIGTVAFAVALGSHYSKTYCTFVGL